MQKPTTKQITAVAMLSALAYIVSFFCSLLLPKIGGFLSFDLKDVILTVTGFIFGPAYALAAAVIVSLTEMLTVSSTGIIGCVMNVIASASFACTASLIYAKNRTMQSAVTGLIAGCLLMTAVMILWNLILTPVYMKVPRSVVKGMLLPLLLPFNLAKGSVNMAAALLIYKPVITALRKTGFVPASQHYTRLHAWLIITAALLITAGAAVLLLLS